MQRLTEAKLRPIEESRNTLGVLTTLGMIFDNPEVVKCYLVNFEKHLSDEIATLASDVYGNSDHIRTELIARSTLRASARAVLNTQINQVQEVLIEPVV